jgi:hypothetical protein
MIKSQVVPPFSCQNFQNIQYFNVTGELAHLGYNLKFCQTLIKWMENNIEII